ncbi:MAG: hypothetical protein KJO07_10745, partial [Deltaproteobacteria bacterium]|nr:hypothetical protein [Deltaproteobacteria bacterium]
MVKPAPRERTALERLLGIFAEVKAGEGFLVVMMFFNIFLILSSYYILKPIRDGLIVGGIELDVGFAVIEGDELKSYLAAFMAFLLIPFVRGYGVLASAVARLKLLNITSGFIIVGIFAFFIPAYFLKVQGVGIAIAYFTWLGIINVFVIAQFWSYANDIYTPGQGKRLFPVIAIGMASGGWFGSEFARAYGEEYMFQLMVLAALGFGACQVLYNYINRRIDRLGTGGDDHDEGKANKEEAPLSKDGGFQLVFRSRYLLLIAFMILLANLVNTTGEFLLSNAAKTESEERYPDNMYTPAWVADVKAGKAALPPGEDAPQAIEDPEQRNKRLKRARKGYGTSFFGSFYAKVNLFVLLLQALLVSRVFKFVGIRGALFVLPLIALLGNFFIAILGSIAVLRFSKIAENSTDYSLQNTLKQALFLPTSREEKYKAKQAIDTFFVRVGDALSGGLVLVGIHALQFGRSGFAAVNVGLAAVWLLVCM